MHFLPLKDNETPLQAIKRAAERSGKGKRLVPCKPRLLMFVKQGTQEAVPTTVYGSCEYTKVFEKNDLVVYR